MILGIFYQSSGLGNQLHRYVATRVLAEQKGYNWGMLYVPNDSSKPPGFKGQSFMNLDTRIHDDVIIERYRSYVEKKITADGDDIRSYDPEFNFIQNDTIIDGEFQDERYWEDYEVALKRWLQTQELDVPDDTCVIGFRGGEYSVYPDLFLTKEYWDSAISKMKEINKDMKFEVHTDDPQLALKFFPEYRVIHDIGINWRSMRCAKYAIIANSSFFIFPRWMRNGYTIAPRYWARRNTKTWCLPQNYYKRFIYL